MQPKVVSFPKHARIARPKTYTSREEVVERVGVAIMESGLTYDKIARDCNLNRRTVENLARGVTKWPKATTLFGLLLYLRLGIQVVPL